MASDIACPRKGGSTLIIRSEISTSAVGKSWSFLLLLASNTSDETEKRSEPREAGGSSGVSALWELNIFVRIIPNVMNN